MEPDKECQITPNRLPKSVKIRSTCNACQQAKIRCSHERPSCRRCQKHNIDCIYSISRRLGRPAKKRDNVLDDLSISRESVQRPSNQLNKRPRSPKKKKVKAESLQKTRGNDQQEQDKIEGDGSPFNTSIIEDIPLEDTGLQTPGFMDMVTDAPFSDNMDLTSDGWLQEFMSNSFTDPINDHEFPDAPEPSNTKASEMEISASMEAKEASTIFRNSSCSLSDDQNSSNGQYSGVNPCLTYHGSTSGGTQGSIEAIPTYQEYLKKDSHAWSQPFSTLVEDFAVNPTGFFGQPKAPKHACEYNLQVDDLRAGSEPTSMNYYQCQTHEQAVRELIRVNICASCTGPSIAIDSVLTCQRVLQQLAETILQCRICSRTRVNLLMVVIVSIDSLVTTLDAITSVESDVVDRLFPECSNLLLQDYRLENTLPNHHNRRSKGSSVHFRTQLDSCPLVIGAFCVPPEEKFSFVKRVLHSRLSGLLGTVRRIRLCTQEVLATSAARGRLIMMMETDRRLQLIMVKMKMLPRP